MSPTMDDKLHKVTASHPVVPVVVLGGGCAGLSAALRLAKRGRRVVVVEQADHVGGLAGGIQFGGNTYEYGPHAFHTTDPEILSDVKELMGPDLLEYNRTIKIRFLGKYFTFPLTIRDVLLRLPKRTVVRAAFSFLWHFGKGLFSKPAVENSETLLMRYYGRVLYEIFFKSYIVKVWGISPAEFSPSFARERIPRLNLLSFLDKVWSAIKNRFTTKVSTEGYVEKVEGKLYTTRLGFSLITQRMAEKVEALGGEVLLNTRATRIVREGRRIHAVELAAPGGGAHKLECEALVNTLPVNEIARMVSPPLPRDVLDAAGQLKYRALVFVGVLVRRPKVLLSSFMYFREHSFNRIAELTQFGFEIQPPGCTALVAEVSCDKSERYWTDDEYAKQAVLDDLEREKLITRDEVVEMHVFRAEHAYPVYTLNYEQHRKTLIDAVEATANMETAGRQGRFAYINTHIAMKMGYEAADRLITKLERKDEASDDSPSANLDQRLGRTG
jgi:protoporphyrinogen oxidase